MDETLDKMDDKGIVEKYRKQEYVVRWYFYLVCFIWINVGVWKQLFSNPKDDGYQLTSMIS